MNGKRVRTVVVLLLIILVTVVAIGVAEVDIPAYIPSHTNIPQPNYPHPRSEGLNISAIFAGFVYAWIVIAIIGVIMYRKHVGKDVLKEVIIGLVAFFITFILFLILLFLGNRLRWSNTGSSGLYEPSYWSVVYFYAALTFFIFLIVYVIMKSVKFEKEPEKRRKITANKEYVEMAIYHLKLGGDVRSAILRAYREMENLIKKKGVEDRNYYTPREFKDAVISELNISEEPVEKLTLLFERARYSTADMTENDRKNALKYLERIRDEITS